MSETQNPGPIEIRVPDDTVSIRQLTMQDAQTYFDLVDSDREHFSQFDDGTADKYKKVEDVADSIRNPKPNRYRFGIWDGNTMVGSINLEKKEDQVAEIGYWVGKEHTGHGYAARALKPMTKFAFEHLGMEEVFTDIVVGNQASRKTVENAGFIFDREEDGYWIHKMKRPSL